MKYYKSNPVGIDVPINTLQNFIYKKLQTLWSLSEVQIKAFPRVYKVEDGYSHFSGGKDYLPANHILDDRYAVQFFFVDRERTFDDLWTANVDVYFGVNLSTVKPSITHRADEEVKQDLYNILQQGSEGVLSIIPIEDMDLKIDMQPFHTFRFTVKLTYRYDKTF